MQPMFPAGHSFFCLVALIVLASCQDSIQEPVRNVKPVDAPDFSVQTLDGDTIHSDSLKGTPVILTFWTTWAPSAVHQLDDLEMLVKQTPLTPGNVLAVCLEEGGIRDLEMFLRHSHFAFDIGKAHPDFQQRFGGIDAVPTTFVINQDWQIINRYTGRIDADVLVDELLWLNQPED